MAAFRVNQPLIQKKIAIVPIRNSNGEITMKRVTAHAPERWTGIWVAGIKATGPNNRLIHENRPVFQYINAAIRSIAPKRMPKIPSKDETVRR